MTDILTVRLPWPDKVLFPNHAPRYLAATWSAKAAYREAARVHALDLINLRQNWTPLMSCRIAITGWYHGRGPAPDHDGLHRAVKADLDGLVDAGVMMDDGPGCVELTTVRSLKDASGESHVTLEVTDES